MIPPPPAASYFEEGWAMISIRSIVVPSVELSRTSSSLPDRFEGLPSIHTATDEPLSLTLPSKSMVTPGALRSRSVPLLPSVDTASETFITILSSFCSITGLLADTTTASSISASGSMLTVPMSVPSAGLTLMTASLYPMNDILRIYSLAVRPLKANFPVESVVVPSTNVLSGSIRATVANSMGADVAASLTLPARLFLLSVCCLASAVPMAVRVSIAIVITVSMRFIAVSKCCCLLNISCRGRIFPR